MRSRAPPVRIVIGEISISAASSLEARRLADALPAALERAFVQFERSAVDVLPRRPRPADRVAAQVVRAVRGQLERR
jgi:hypothetical protein